jgi:hypothetical protein
MKNTSTRLLLSCAALGVAGGILFVVNAYIGGTVNAVAPMLYGLTLGVYFLPGAIACRATVGATITPIVHPGQAPPEPRYRPSKKLADFVRCRDLTCRFPGCKVPATNCDVDREHGGVSPPAVV